MNWFLGVLYALSFLMFLYVVSGLMASSKTSKKRHQLINRWTTSGGDWKLARTEFDEVDYKTHCRSCLWLQNPKKLYGPLIQGVWDDDQQKVYDKFWWRCYNEIYLKLEPYNQARIKYVMAKGSMNTHVGKNYLPIALAVCYYDIEAWLAQSPPPADKFTMTAGAEEYEQIMAMQDLIDG